MKVILLLVCAVVVAIAQPQAPPTVAKPAVDPGFGKCPNDCTNNGICRGGTCVCYAGYTGNDCSQVIPCKNDCHYHGECRSGICFCYPGFSGDDCSGTEDDMALQIRALVADAIRGYYKECTRMEPEKVALDSFVNSVMGDKETLVTVREKICEPIPCPNDCSGRGVCMFGRCECYEGWVGEDCGDKQTECPNGCSGHGLCLANGQCECERRWGGKDCSKIRCPNDCSGNGMCINGTCRCDRSHAGEDCSKMWYEATCKNDCTQRGQCVNGKCVCKYGFGGEDCSESRLYTLSFDSDDAVMWSPASSFPTDEITLEFYVKVENGPKAPSAMSYAYGNQINVFSVLNLRELDVIVMGEHAPKAGVNVADGQWHHIAVTWRSRDGQTIVYKDGQTVITRSIAKGKALPSGGSLVIGQAQDEKGGFDSVMALGGLMTEFRIWNVVRNVGEISQFMKSPLKGNEDGLVAYYRFEDVETSTSSNEPRMGLRMIRDSTSNGNEAQVRGTPEYTGDKPALEDLPEKEGAVLQKPFMQEAPREGFSAQWQ